MHELTQLIDYFGGHWTLSVTLLRVQWSGAECNALHAAFDGQTVDCLQKATTTTTTTRHWTQLNSRLDCVR